MSDSYKYDDDVIKARKSEIPVHPLILSRTAPYELTGEEIPTEDLMKLFEAARWAPSCYNWQPWRFVYAKRNTSNWQKFLDLLVPPNKEWAQHAGALIIIVSKKHALHRGSTVPNPTYSFDTGAAWAQLGLEGSALGYAVHGMAGFDYDKAYEVVEASKELYNVDAMVAVGKQPEKESRKRDQKITLRNPIDSFAFEGKLEEKDSE